MYVDASAGGTTPLNLTRISNGCYTLKQEMLLYLLLPAACRGGGHPLVLESLMPGGKKSGRYLVRARRRQPENYEQELLKNDKC